MNQRDVRGSTGIVFNAFDSMFPGCIAVEINDADSPFCTVTAMADADLAAVVTAADVLTFAWEGEREVGSAAVEVVVYWSSEMADTGCSGLVGAELEGRFWSVFGADRGLVGINFWHGVGCCDWRGRSVVDCLGFGVGAKGGVGEQGTQLLNVTEAYSWL